MNLHHGVDNFAPASPHAGDIGAPVYGNRGPLTPLQSRNVIGAYEARQLANEQLGRGSNSGAVESKQWSSMVNGSYGD
jgi:hypothetical protein